MKRRSIVKSIMLGSLGLPFQQSILNNAFNSNDKKVVFKSEWHLWPDMRWVGPEYWGNRLQDWSISKGKLSCNIIGKGRMLSILPVINGKGAISQTMSIEVMINTEVDISKYNGVIGFKIGMSGPIDDYRSSAVFGKGMNVGIHPSGSKVIIGDKEIETGLRQLPAYIEWKVVSTVKGLNTDLQVSIYDKGIKKNLFTSEKITVNAEEIKGTASILVDFDVEKMIKKKALSFSNFKWIGDGLSYKKDHTFGPICFAQYTTDKKKLKLSAQCAPVENIKDHQLSLELYQNEKWVLQSKKKITNYSRTVLFEINQYESNTSTPYRLILDLPLKERKNKYLYQGMIVQEPKQQQEVKAAVFSCNFHYGFPDTEVVTAIEKIKPDLALFLGDQFYEGTGGYGAEYEGDMDDLSLDYLRKWYMFGWSYRAIFKDIPSIILPDDHDVYHGNVWGESGKAADNTKGYGAPSQDSGGYKMPAEWVNMVQETQTSHLPDPIDPTPVNQNIKVYFTHWKYAGLSFAILEDRKFKSAPKNVLPAEAQVSNGWILNEKFDITQYEDVDAELLGARQEKFLEDWVMDWEDCEMKTVLSQTNFVAIGTLPKGSKTGAVIPSLPIPNLGEYVKGDEATIDMDTNGWPVRKRNKAIETLRKGFAFHITGDQHLASFIRYGLEEYEDSGYVFAGPALSNLWPRRFWPETTKTHSMQSPAYVGNHLDGFANKMTVVACANPYKSGKEPAALYDRAVGFGVVTYDKSNRTIRTDCWPRGVEVDNDQNQYNGWPITIKQTGNYGRRPQAWLPTFEIIGEDKPIIYIYNEAQELIYSMKLSSPVFQPWVFSEGNYDVKFTFPGRDKTKTWKNIQAVKNQNERIMIDAASI
jgi:alkaline phosphatase D